MMPDMKTICLDIFGKLITIIIKNECCKLKIREIMNQKMYVIFHSNALNLFFKNNLKN